MTTTTPSSSSSPPLRLASSPIMWLSTAVLSMLLSAGPAQAQAPTITGLVPTRNAVAAPRTTPVSVTFDQPLSNTFSTQQALKVFSQQAGGLKAGTATVSGNTLSLAPGTGFKAGETVYATLTAGAQSSSGQSLARPQVFQFTTATAPAPGTFSGSEVAVNSSPQTIISGDVDGDGDLDFLTVSSGYPASIVKICLNNGSGSFVNGPDVSTGANTNTLVLGDVDGDGDLDLAVGYSFNFGMISIRLNDGRGTFTASQEVSVGGISPSFVLGDVDADGDLDILSTNNGGNTASIRLNDGRGVFYGSQQVPVSNNPANIAAGDVDNDGDLDLLTSYASYNGTVSVRLNDGAGSFSGNQEVAVGNNPTLIALGDLDGDGDLDLLTSSYNSTASVRFNNGSGSFSGTQEVAVALAGFIARLGDVDGDGDLDILATNSNTTSSTVSIRLNDGRGSFSGSQQVPVGAYLSNLAIGDLDGDGDLDFLASCYVTNVFSSSGAVSVRLNQPVFQVASLLPARNAPAAPRSTNVAVGFSQPVSTNAATQQALKVFSQQAGGRKAGAATVSSNTLTFDPSQDFKAGETVYATLTTTAQSSSGEAPDRPQVFQFTTATTPSAGAFSGGSDPAVGAQPRSIVAGDIDGDGDLDLLTANFGVNGNVSVRLNNRQGSFNGTATVSVGTGTASSKLVLGDVDADGDLDLVASNRQGVSVRLNDGKGSFSAGQELSLLNSPTDLILADIDGDGDLDLLLNTESGSRVAASFNDGRGTFSAPVQQPIGAAPGIAVGDVDNDGDLDLLVAGPGANLVGVYLNDGRGSFSGRQSVSVSYQPYGVLLGDLDADGDLDLVSVNNSSTASIRLNNGLGSFSGSQEVPVGGGFLPMGSLINYSGGLGDVDGDGDLDLLVAPPLGSTGLVSVRLNDGKGAFSGSQQVAVGPTPASLTLADLDGDGTLDLATANSSSSGTVSVRLNNHLVLATGAAARTAQLGVYPNPAQGSCILSYSADKAQAATLHLTDGLGRQVYQQAVQLISGANQVPVEATSLSAGLYQLTLRLADGQRLSRKLLVQP